MHYVPITYARQQPASLEQKKQTNNKHFLLIKAVARDNKLTYIDWSN